jgi:AraC family transcriptional regulator
MRTQKNRLVRVMSEEEILGITGTLPHVTSIGRNWTGIEVHRYRLSGPSQTCEFRLPQLAIFLPHLDHPCRARQEIGDNTLTKDVGHDAVTIAPAALTRRVSIERAHELTAIFLDPLVFGEIARAETGMRYPEIMPQFAIADPLIRSLGMALDKEMRSTNPKPVSYGERLAVTLASHIFATYAKPVYREMRSLGPHWIKLRRCIDHMHENMDQPLSWDQLARVAGMSKFHFAKAFRDAMGIAPHQYLVKLRVETARALLRDDTISVSDVGGRVGYADLGQFTSQFRKIIGVSPTQYRRQTTKSQ